MLFNNLNILLYYAGMIVYILHTIIPDSIYNSYTNYGINYTTNSKYTT